MPTSRFFRTSSDNSTPKQDLKTLPKLLNKKSMIELSRPANLTHGVGTPLYMSPEQAASKIYSGKTDMYSLGIILFEMVYAPFSSETHRIITLSNLRKLHPEYPMDLDAKVPEGYEEFIQLVRNLVQHDPQKRKSSKSLFEKYQDELY